MDRQLQTEAFTCYSMKEVLNGMVVWDINLYPRYVQFCMKSCAFFKSISNSYTVYVKNLRKKNLVISLPENVQ